MTESAFSGLIIAHGERFASSPCHTLLTEKGLRCCPVTSAEALVRLKPALIVADAMLRQQIPDLPARADELGALLLAEIDDPEPADFYLPQGFVGQASYKNFRMALSHWVLNRHNRDTDRDLSLQKDHLNLLAEIGIALSAEKNLGTLLERVLSEGRQLAQCDAASLFLVDRSDPEYPQLVFKLAQNASIEYPMEERRFALDDRSIVGYVAAHGHELNVADAYAIDDAAPYSFNGSFDERMAYRSISLLALPMCNHRGEVIGVLQFINHTRTRGARLTSPSRAQQESIPFAEETLPLLRALCSHAAIAIENRVLLESIRRLFDGFVRASVAAIEQRDPATSGHSFRVADLSEALARALPEAHKSRFQSFNPSGQAFKELRYAALLHDFGKVGVREQVLTKAKKLSAHQLDVALYRLRLVQETLRRQTAERCMQMLRDQVPEAEIQQLLHYSETEQRRLQRFWERLVRANEPSILPEEISAELDELHRYQALDIDGVVRPLISKPELHALQIPKGSLSDLERQEIQDHVVHTEQFLKLIPWTPELSGIPEIAAAHHEKLDGSGYPRGLESNRIPLAAKIMTICDIFDALTASDRPYKPAVPFEFAFKILNDEAGRGLLDQELVDLFIEARVFETIRGKHYVSDTLKASEFHHHVCDFDLLDRHHHQDHS